MKVSLIWLASMLCVLATPSPQIKDPKPKNVMDSPNFGKTAVPFGPKPSGCSKFEILVARGTSEPGPFGVIAGDPLVKNVVAAVPEARGYAVQYPAMLSAESVAIGTKDVVDRLTGQHTACPAQKFALVGYSQGARVMRAASVKISRSLYPDIVAMVMFGDRGMRDMNITQFPSELQGKLLENCAPRDPGCSGVGTDSAPHLTYNNPGTTYQADSAKSVYEEHLYSDKYSYSSTSTYATRWTDIV